MSQIECYDIVHVDKLHVYKLTCHCIAKLSSSSREFTLKRVDKFKFTQLEHANSNMYSGVVEWA